MPSSKWHHRDNGMLRTRYLPLSSLTSYGLPQSPDARFPKKGHVGPDKGPINRKLSSFLTPNPAPRQLNVQAPFCSSLLPKPTALTAWMVTRTASLIKDSVGICTFIVVVTTLPCRTKHYRVLPLLQCHYYQPRKAEKKVYMDMAKYT